jgi:MOSC domain-containing protein YiiM
MSFEGRLLAICFCPTRGESMQPVNSIELIAGRGLSGDRYANKQKTEPAQEVTLIEEEALTAAERDCQLALTHAEIRRNLLTAGVPLNHLVGRQFSVGNAVLEGIELCEPCSHLERLTGRKVIEALLHRGGLRARVVRGGTIQPGDEIR